MRGFFDEEKEDADDEGCGEDADEPAKAGDGGPVQAIDAMNAELVHEVD